MGETYANVKVFPLRNEHAVAEIRMLVDTGATLTVLPRSALKKAGVRPQDRVTLKPGDGREIKRQVGNAFYEVKGVRVATPVVFGAKKDAPVLGLLSLEAARLSVDPVRRRLTPVRSVHQY